MNWQFLLMSIFGLSIFFVVVVTILFYLQHRLARMHRRSDKPMAHPTDGRYFRRFLPIELADSYEKRIQQFNAMKRPVFTWRDYKWHIAVIVLATVIVAKFAIDHRYDYLAPVDITESEFQTISRISNKLEVAATERPPAFSEMLKVIQQKKLVLLKSSDALPAKLGLSHWKKWSEENNISVRECALKNWRACGGAVESNIYVALPGPWETKILDELVQAGASLLIYGPPLQALNDQWEWQGVRFEKVTRSLTPHLVLAGDSLLTLGFDAGSVLAAVPFNNSYAMKSESADGYAIHTDRSFSGSIDSRLKAATVQNSRLVWMDFSPNIKDQPAIINENLFSSVLAAVFRFLSRQEYSAIATWPGGARFGGVIAYNVDDHPERSALVERLVEDEKFPVTWFLTSDFVQKSKILRNLSDVGELACVSDSKTALTQDPINQQIRRLARCQKVMIELNSYEPVGLHPPEEQFNNDTIDALINVGYNYIFSRSDNEKLVPSIRRSNILGKNLVFLNRSTSDDFHLMNVVGLSRSEAKSRVKNEIQWLKMTGGLYSYSFSSHNLDLNQLDVVRNIASYLEEEKAYFQTARDISLWWSYRTALISDAPVQSALQERFKPVRLTVGIDGRLTSKPL